MTYWFSIALATAAFVVLRSLPATRLMPVRLIGVVYHEAGHWLLAAITWSNPSRVRIPWEVDKGEITYGEVSFTPGTFTAALVALAPLVFTPWALTFLLSQGPISALAAAPVLAHGFPSVADWKVALRHPFSWPLAALAVFASTFTWMTLWLN